MNVSILRQRLVAGFFVAAILSGAASSEAATVKFRTYLDLDNAAATPAPACPGALPGAEQRLTATVDTSSGQLTALALETCTGGAYVPYAGPNPFTTFTPPWNVVRGQGVGGSDAIELYYPLSLAPGGRTVRFAVDSIATTPGATPADTLSTVNGQVVGSPILLEIAGTVVPIPTLSEWGLLAFGIFLAVAALVLLRKRPAGRAAFLALFALGTVLAGVAMAAIVPNDNSVLDWTGVSPLANDPSGDAPSNLDIVAFFTKVEGSTLFLRVDAKLNSVPSVATSPGTTAFTEAGPAVAVDAGVTASDDSGTLVGATVTLAPIPDGAQESLAANVGATGILAAYNSATGVLTLSGSTSDANYQQVLRSIVYNNTSLNPSTAARTASYVVDDGTFTSATAVKNLSVAAVNTAPTVNAATFSLAENSANGTVVGTATGNDPEGQTLSWSITAGNTGGAFAINPATGQITVANTAAVDFETTPTFALTVQATDNGTPTAASGSNTVTVNLTNVNDAPVINPQTFSVAENSANGTVVGTAAATDADLPAQTLTWSITAGNTGGAFAINTANGQITVATAGAVDFETNPTFTLTVQVADNGTPALNASAPITINVTNVNEAPVVTGQTVSIAENTANGTNVGTPVAFTDGDTGQTHTYSITAGNTGGAFAINAGTGQITVATSSALNFETTPTFTLTVTVTDNGTPVQTGTATVTVNLTNVNEAPSVTGQTVSIAENTANGTNVGTPVAATDPDVPAQTLTWSITAGNTGGAFAINAATGQITVATSSALNFETTPTFTLTITVTDNGTPVQSGTATVTVNLTNVNEAPSVTGQTVSINENTANGTNVGTPVVATDPDTGQTLTYSITAGNTGGAFAINAATGQITVATSAALNFETTPTFTLTITVTDNGTPVQSGTGTVTVNLNNVNESPVVTPQTVAINENTANGTNVGTPVVATDPDTGQTLTYSITAGNTGGAFAINAATGQVTVANSAALNFETTPSFTLTITVTDNGTPVLSGTASFTVNLNNVNEAPSVTGQTVSINENTANGTNVGTPVVATDPDVPVQTLTYAITAGNTGGAFAINPATGQVTVATSSALNFETTPTFNLTITVTDNGTPVLSGTATFTVNLVNVNEAPSVTGQTVSINENTANGTNVGTPVAATDPDVPVQTLTYSITAGNTGGAFAINAATGQITVANSAALNFETTPSFSLTITVTDNGTPVLSGTATFTVNLTNVNEAPSVTGQTVSINENTANGTNVGTPVVATDPDTGQTLTYAITAGNTGGAFAINAATGQITVATSSALNFETTPTFSLTITVSDNGTPVLTGTATVTVNLVNVNEAPVVTGQTASVNEHSANGTLVGTPVVATDQDVPAQTLTYSITAGNTGGTFAINPATGQVSVANNAVLDFAANPTFNLTITVTDNGTPAQAGTATFTVNVLNINDPPVVTGQTVAINENTANGTNVGTPVAFTDLDTGQTHTFSITAGNTGGAFAINAATGQVTVANVGALNFEVTPTFSLTITVTDNGTPVLSGSATFTVNLINVNEAPSAVGDSYTVLGNTQLRVAGHPGTGLFGITSATNPLTNDTDPDQIPAFNTLSAVAATGTSANGGNFTIAADGSFHYTPPAGFTGVDTFNFTLTDGTNNVTETVTVTVSQRVWYVRDLIDGQNAAGGDGRTTNAFETLTAAETAATATGDIIFVYAGGTATTPLAAGITLKDGQKLWGEGIGLTVAPFGSLVAAGTKPKVNAAATSAVIVAATAAARQNVEIRGMDLQGNPNAVNVNSTGANAVGVTISDNTVSGSTIEGIKVTAGSTGTQTYAISNNTITAGVRGINITRTAGTPTVTAFANNVITGNTGGSGIEIDGVSFDTAVGAPITTVSGGTTVIGQSGNGVSTNGMLLTNVTGDLSFTDLDIFNDAGAGLRITSTGQLNAGAGTGFRLAVASGVSTIDSNGGPAIDVNNASFNLPSMAFLRSTNSTTTGVSLVNAFGGVGGTTLSATGGRIDDPAAGGSGTAFNVDGGTGNITYPGPITSTSGTTVAVANRTGDSVSLSGTIGTSLTSGGISLTNNTGATVSFTGALTLTTTTNDAFTATGGGTVSTTDTTSTITTTTGRGINVANTTIGAGGLKFQSVSAGTAASGPANGILLNNTGAGALTISGTGGAGTGGTIQKTTGDGISLTSVSGVNLSSMNISTSAANGINGTTVAGLNLTACNLTNNGTTTSHAGINLATLTGSNTWSTVSVTGSAHDNVFIDNASGTLTALNISGSSFNNNNATTGNHGFLMQARGTSTTTAVSVTGSNFNNNKSIGMQITTGDTATISSFTVSSNTFQNNQISMDFSKAQTSNLTFKILGNTITGQNSHGLNVFTAAGAGTTGQLRGRIENNTIGNAAVVNSGSAIGNCMRININGDATASVLVNNNILRQCPNGRGIEAVGRNGVGGLDLTVTNNDVNPQDTSGIPLAAIFVQSNAITVPNTVRSDVRGNTVPAGATSDLLGTYLAVVESGGSTSQLVGVQPTGTAQLTATNTGSASASAGVAIIAGPITTPP